MTPSTNAEARQETLERLRNIVLAFALIAVTLGIATAFARLGPNWIR
jgi:hypothetical protein